MIQRYEEFRVILTPIVPTSDPNAAAGPPQWRVRLETRPEGPFGSFAGDKGVATSAVTHGDLARLRDRNGYPAPGFLIGVGHNVWKSLMTPDLQAAFNLAFSQSQLQGFGLRLVVVPLSPDGPSVPHTEFVGLDEIPFELLRRPPELNQAKYVGAQDVTPISRGLPVARPLPPHPIVGPLRILVVVADPDDMPPLDAAAEKRAIEEALEPAQTNRQIHVEFCEPTLQSLQRKLQLGPWHVLHFAGHGGIEPSPDGLTQGYLGFVEPASLGTPFKRVHKVAAETLGISLSDAPELKLIVLTACSSAAQPGNPNGIAETRRGFESVAYHLLVNDQTSAVVAMQFDLETDAAAIFTRSFYEGVRADLSLDQSVTNARQAIITDPRFTEGHRAWACPTLVWRCLDGRVFQSACGLADEDRLTLQSLRNRFETVKESLVDFFGTLANLQQEVRRELLKSSYLDDQKTKLEANLEAQARLLGGVVRVSTAAAQPGGTALVRLFLRTAHRMPVASVRVRVRYPSSALRFNRWSIASAMPPMTESFTNTDVGETTVRVDFPDPVVDDWPAGEEKELGQFEFSVLDDQPPGVLDLGIPDQPDVRGGGADCFSGLNSLVFVDFPED